ncbi:uncharacterized protein ALTATR162_LOCUS3352 [Alternaria atra]|uniref:Uncharacterized protein n=1 Tax=Alternaria atra TaxID=119953 RepID=A0A8J2I016_9PLEO|nr:uncharacterized protein ALTATR162_LOCUS3352 [Alternaria atra]CAG5153842.1 unnamed protein product [Alternaria atra]
MASTRKDGNDIYAVLRGALYDRIGPLYNIVVWHSERKEKVRLDYKYLHSGVAYRIEATLEGHQQGPGISASGGYKKVQRYPVAMGYLVAAVQARRERGEDPGEVTSGDCKAAMAWMMTSTADQAYAQLPEERADTQSFVGGLIKAAQQALEGTEAEGAVVGSEYEEGGKFNIGIHFWSAC